MEAYFIDSIHSLIKTGRHQVNWMKIEREMRFRFNATTSMCTQCKLQIDWQIQWTPKSSTVKGIWHTKLFEWTNASHVVSKFPIVCDCQCERHGHIRMHRIRIVMCSIKVQFDILFAKQNHSIALTNCNEPKHNILFISNSGPARNTFFATSVFLLFHSNHQRARENMISFENDETIEINYWKGHVISHNECEVQ